MEAEIWAYNNANAPGATFCFTLPFNPKSSVQKRELLNRYHIRISFVVSDNSGSAIFSIKHLSERIKSGQISRTDLIGVSLNRIKKLNPLLNAFITVVEEDKLYKQAQIADKEISLGKYRGPLHGLPFSIKDIIYARGIRCTAGSKILTDFVPKSSATVVQKNEKSRGNPYRNK